MANYTAPVRSDVDYDLRTTYIAPTRSDVDFKLSLSRRRASETGGQVASALGRNGNDASAIGRNGNQVQEL